MTNQDPGPDILEGDPTPSLVSGALDFLKRTPLFVTVQGYRNTALETDEVLALSEHLDSWRMLLSRHGILYDGIMVGEGQSEYADLIYHFSTAVETYQYPAAFPLLMDAVYELTTHLPVEWEVHVVEQLVTRFEASPSEKGFLPGQRIFAPRIKGQAATEEHSQSPEGVSTILLAEE